MSFCTGQRSFKVARLSESFLFSIPSRRLGLLWSDTHFFPAFLKPFRFVCLPAAPAKLAVVSPSETTQSRIRIELIDAALADYDDDISSDLNDLLLLLAK